MLDNRLIAKGRNWNTFMLNSQLDGGMLIMVVCQHVTSDPDKKYTLTKIKDPSFVVSPDKQSIR